MLKILHTADWHIGKKLHEYSLAAEMDLFAGWLKNKIQEEGIDVLLLSGDVFDHANPSNEAREQYFGILRSLVGLNCTLVVTGGNHDSPFVLDGPSELFQLLNIHVVGGMPTNIADVLVPLKNKEGQVEAVVAALPFIRDADLRQQVLSDKGPSAEELLRQGIEKIYREAAEACERLFPGLPAIAMGHLYAAGAQVSESEREIQMGNLAAVGEKQFGDFFQYIALGHIHKPQKVNDNERIQYSGSPVALSFSEKEDHKRVLQLELQQQEWKIESVALPCWRKLVSISGSLEELKSALASFSLKQTETLLPDLLELHMVEDHYDPVKLTQLDELCAAFSKTEEGEERPNAIILKKRTDFKNRLQATDALYDEEQLLKELEPMDVFTKMITQTPIEPAQQQVLLQLFREMLQEVQQQ